MIGRGHLAGPCLALSYVERAISVLEYFFSIPIFPFSSFQSFPPNFSLPLSIYPFPSHHRPPRTTRHRRSPSLATAVLHLWPPPFSIFGQLHRSSSSGCLPSPAVFQFRSSSISGRLPVPVTIRNQCSTSSSL